MGTAVECQRWGGSAVSVAFVGMPTATSVRTRAVHRTRDLIYDCGVRDSACSVETEIVRFDLLHQLLDLLVFSVYLDVSRHTQDAEMR